MAEKEWLISHILSISVILQWQVCALFLKPVKIWRRKKNNPKLCTCMSRHKRQRDVFSLKKYKLHLGRFTGILNLNMHWSLFLWKFNSSLKFVDRRIKNPKVRNFHFIFFTSVVAQSVSICVQQAGFIPFLRRTRGKNVTLQLLSWQITVSFEAFSFKFFCILYDAEKRITKLFVSFALRL